MAELIYFGELPLEKVLTSLFIPRYSLTRLHHHFDFSIRNVPPHFMVMDKENSFKINLFIYTHKT